jgi:hypothetical protein
MAYNVTTTYRSPLLAGGKSSTGAAVQNKTLIFGVINVTSYTTGGETVNPQDFGLETIDQLLFNVRTLNDAATVPAAATIGLAGFNRTLNKMIVNTTGTTEVTSGEDAVVGFLAIGDSAGAPILT